MASGRRVCFDGGNGGRQGTGASSEGRDMAAIPGHRVVVFIQENKTTDFYFPTMTFEWK